MLPFVKHSWQDFGPVFERYANDLKEAAELSRPSSANEQTIERRSENTASAR
jgi:hypothetical protein